MIRPLALLLLAALPAAAQTETATRLIVADHAAPTVLVLAADGAPMLRLDTGEPVRLHEGAHHGQVALRAPVAGRVTLLETGLRLEGHGDHADLSVAAPALLPTLLQGPRPSHVTGGDGRVAVFFDGDGTVGVAGPAGITQLRAAHPHHGVAYPFAGGMMLVSEAAANDRPSGVVLRGPDGAEVARSADCPRLHGEARTGPLIAFGCADGVLVFDTTTKAFAKVPNPSDAGERMVRNLAGGEDWRLLVGDFGADGMVVIDPEARTMRRIALPARRLHFALDPNHAETLHVLTEDGTLHAISTLDGAVRATVRATGRYSLEGGGAVARPRLSAAGGQVAVSDPASGRVVLFDGATLAPGRTLALGGAPFDIRLVSLTGERH